MARTDQAVFCLIGIENMFSTESLSLEVIGDSAILTLFMFNVCFLRRTVFRIADSPQ